ncbi:hypothetical protein D8820_06385 [Streptococcus sanguinis]|nr:hypothetical protein D8820_06385 [Streptococcus sanguinis]
MNIKRNHLLKALIIYGALAFSFFLLSEVMLKQIMVEIT